MSLIRLTNCSLVLAAGLSAYAQSIYIPPDYFGEDYRSPSASGRMRAK